MKTKSKNFAIMIVVFLLVNLACQTVTGLVSPETEAAPAPEQVAPPESAAPAEEAPPTEAPVETEAPTAQVEAQPEQPIIRQWAVSAAASSEYSSPDWGAVQAVGAPDTLINECADAVTAWASAGSDTVEWLELSYATPVVPTEINILQTHSPDQVVQVDVVDSNGTYHTIYTGTPENLWEKCPYTLTIPVEADYAVTGVKITIDQSVIDPTWNEIDAVELVGYAPNLEAAPPSSAEGVFWRFGGVQGYEEGQYGSVNGLDATADGLVYVADSSVGVRVLNAADGTEVRQFGHDDLWSPTGVRVAPNGNIYVSDWGENLIFVFSPDGELLFTFGGEGNGPGEFGGFSPESFAINQKGDVFVLDENETDAGESLYRIQVFNAEGVYQREFPLANNPEIEGMDFGPDENLYMVDWFGDVILKYAPDGALLDALGAEALDFASPQDLAIDDEGYFYVAIWSPDSVMKLDPSGNLVAQFGVDVEDGESAWPEGAFYSIEGVTVLPDGSRLFASDWSGSYSYVTAFEFK